MKMAAVFREKLVNNGKNSCEKSRRKKVCCFFWGGVVDGSLRRVHGEAEPHQTNDASVVRRRLLGYCSGLTGFTNGPHLLLIAERLLTRVLDLTF